MSNSITDGESERASSLCRPRLLIPSLFLSPGGGGITGIRHWICAFCVLLGLLGRIFALPKRAAKTTSKKHRKKCENRGFWPSKTIPKPSQNPLKIEVPKNMWFFIDFCSKNLLPQKCRHGFRIGFYQSKWLSDVFLQVAFWMGLGSKKRSKNLSKTMPGRLKNRSQKHVVF